jgi:cyclase
VRRIIGCAIVFLFLGLSGNAVGQEIGGTHTLTRLSEGVYAVHGKFQGANAAIIINAEDVLIVDSHGSPASAAALLKDVKQLTDLPVRYVVNTHWHADHHTGNQAYFQAFARNVQFISHHLTREDIPELARQQLQDVRAFMEGPVEGAREQLRTGLDDHGNPLTLEQQTQIEAFAREQEEFLATLDADEFEFVLPNLTFERSLTVHTETRSIQILYFHKAHTRGDVVVYLPIEKIVIAGDLLTQPILWSWSSYPAEYIQTLRAVEELDFERMVIGHGEILTGKAYLIQTRQFLEAVVEEVQRSVANDVALNQAQEGAAESRVIQSFRRRFVEDTLDENEMFDQMVTWTVERAFLEEKGELD